MSDESPKKPGTRPLAPPPESPFAAAQNIRQLDHKSGVDLPEPSGKWHVPRPPSNGNDSQGPNGAPKAVLQARSLDKSFGNRQVVCGVDIDVGAGEIVGLLGRNGAGKTTTFRMIMGLLHPDKGKVLYEGAEVTKLPMYKRAKKGIGYLAQLPSVFQRMTVEENLRAILELQIGARVQREKRLEELIHNLGLETIRKSIAAVVSGGERRRLEIARAMSLNPKIVLFDEPFAGIDPITVSEIKSILRKLRDQGVGILLTDHNVRETLDVTNRAYIIDDGKVLVHGSPREVATNKEVLERYLGHDFRLDF